MDWLVFSLLASLLWGIGQVILKKGFQNLSPLWSAVVSASINLLFYVPFALMNHASLSIPIHVVFIILVITTFYIFFFYAIERGQLAFAGTIFATYPITTVILSAIFLNETLSIFQILLIGLVIVGSMLIAHDGKKISGISIKKSWLFWAILGSVTTGAADFGAKIVLNTVPLHTYNFYYPLLYFISVGLFWLIDTNGRQLKVLKPKSFTYTVIGVVFLTIGLLCLNYAFSLYKVSITSAVASSYMGVTILLSALLLKERISKQQLIALTLIVLGIMFMGIT